MTPTLAEQQLNLAIAMLQTVEDYDAVINDAFDDGCHTLFKGCVLQAFTRAVMRRHPAIAQGVADSYHQFLYLNFEPLDVIGLQFE